MASTTAVPRRQNSSLSDKQESINEKGDAAIYLEQSAEDAARTYNGVLTLEEADFYHAFPESARDKAYRKVDIRLVPMLALLYLFSCVLHHTPQRKALC